MINFFNLKNEKNKPLLLSLLIVVLTFLYFWQSLEIPFYLDDYSTIVENPWVHSLTHIPTLLTDGRTYANVGIPFERQIPSISFAFNYWFAGNSADPLLFRIFNILLHLLCGWGIYHLFKALYPEGKKKYALIASTLFLFLPGTIQPVIYINARTESLTLFFILFTFIFYIKTLKNFEIKFKKKQGVFNKNSFFIPYGLSLLFYLCASFTKMTSVIILPIIFIYGFLFYSHLQKKHLILFYPFLFISCFRFFYFHHIMSTLQISFPLLLFIVFSLYFLFSITLPFLYKKNKVWRFSLWSTFSAILFVLFFISIWNSELQTPWYSNLFFKNLFSQISFLPLYLLKIFIPYKLSILHDPPRMPNATWVSFGFLSILMLMGCLLILFQKNKKSFFLIFSFFISLMVYFFPKLILLFNENRLYIPTAFLSIYLASLVPFFETYTRTIQNNKIKNLIKTSFILLILNQCYWTQSYFKTLQNEKETLERTLHFYPDGLLAFNQYADYLVKNEPTSFYPEILKTISQKAKKLYNSTSPDARDDYFNLYVPYLAEKILLLSIQLKNEKTFQSIKSFFSVYFPQHPPYFYYLSLYYKSKEQYAEALHALEAYRFALKGKKDAYYRLKGEIYIASNQLENALKIYQEAENAGISDPQIYQFYGLLLKEFNENKKALDILKKSRDEFIKKGDPHRAQWIQQIMDETENTNSSL